ncbi:pectate lyase [Cellulomonas cellasea]|uniref:pectate lyase n=2 Tax=Cellulomonas cellasea TaxID=43670 RepID=A0A4Y3L4D3_9CELL|nr:pectate lyase [Cellulomonas cellasea]GEA89698.1 hypothetical protein CCE01nite_36470 [Cellulomonas cellasea]
MTTSPTRARRGARLRAALTGAVALLVAGTGAVLTAPAASAATVDTSAWYVLVNRQSGKALDVLSSSKDDGAQIIQYTRADAANQQFQFVSSGSGYYRLKSRSSGKVLDVWEWSTAAGAQIRQYTDANGDNQQFRLADSEGGRVRLVSKLSGKVVEVKDRSTANGALVVQGDDGNQYNQQWQLVKVGSGTTSPTTPPATTAPTTPTSWPTPRSSTKVSSTIKVSGTRDMGLVRYYGISSGDQGESQPPMFQLENGAVLKNVILGTGAGDGIHCLGTCTIENVWFEDVGEDAATFKGTAASQTMTINGGGARSASDKVFQHNGPGTFVIKNFQVADIGKLYRSCGNCSKQYARTVVVQNVTITAPAKSLVGINPNLGDKATLSGLTIVGDPSKKIAICDEYKGVTSGEPTKVSSGPSAACGYTPSAIVYR